MKGRREGEEMGRARKIICSSFLRQGQQRTQKRKKKENYFSNKNCKHLLYMRSNVQKNRCFLIFRSSVYVYVYMYIQ